MKPRHVLMTLIISLGVLPLAPAAERGGTLEELTVEQAIDMALTHHPEIKEFQARLDAARGRAIEAGAFPNPEAIARVEGAPIRSSRLQAEYLAGVAQTVPLGGRLQAARDAEELDVQKVQADLDVRHMELRRRVRAEFAATLYAQGVVQFQKTRQESGAKLFQMAQARVQAGDILPEEATRLELAALQSRTEMEQALGALRRAQRALALSMGDPAFEIKALKGSIEELLAFPEMENAVRELAGLLKSNDAEIAALRARFRQARRERIPDIDLELLYRRMEGSSEDAFDFGVRVAIPVFNRQQGRVRSAQADLSAAEIRRGRVQGEIQAKTQDLLEEIPRAMEYLARTKLARTRAESILQVGEARYREGDTSLGDLLKLQQEWSSFQMHYLESVRAVVVLWQSI